MMGRLDHNHVRHQQYERVFNHTLHGFGSMQARLRSNDDGQVKTATQRVLLSIDLVCIQ